MAGITPIGAPTVGSDRGRPNATHRATAAVEQQTAQLEPESLIAARLGSAKPQRLVLRSDR